jgi:cobaltochelatase CobT
MESALPHLRGRRKAPEAKGRERKAQAATGEYQTLTSFDEVRQVDRAFNVRTQPLLAEGAEQVRRLACKLKADLQGQAPMWEGAQRTGPAVDPSSLYRLGLGEDRILKRRLLARDLEAAVSLLVDFSGSMSGLKIDLAVKLAMVFARTCDSIGVPSEVLGFTTAEPKEALQAPWTAGRRRLEPLLHLVIKPWDLTFRRAQHAFANALSAVMLRNNFDGEAVRWAAGRLAERKEGRKVLIVLSDGLPAGKLSGLRPEQVLRAHLKESIEAVCRRGIRCIGFGIQHVEVRAFYPHHMVFQKLDDLMKDAFGELSRIIRGRP